MALRQTHSQSHAAHGGRIGAAAPQRETSQLQRSYIYVRSNTDRKCTLTVEGAQTFFRVVTALGTSYACRFGYGGPYPSMWRHLCANAQGIVLRSSVPARSKKCTVLRRTAVRDRCVSRSLHSRFALPSPFSAIDWLHTPHGSQARPARFLVGSARSMAYVRAVAVEPQRQKRALMATSPQTSSHSGSI